MASPILFSISIVSHAQGGLVHQLLGDIGKYCDMPLEVILTLNVPELFLPVPSAYSFPLRVIENYEPKGFGSNHNAAFALARGDFFCVVNPDIRLSGDPFPALKQCLLKPNMGVVAPLILNAEGEIEDSARKFPTPFSLLGKALGLRKNLDYTIGNNLLFPDWLGGMLLLFPSSVYREISGFDERYFLYYEDVDLCARLSLTEYRVVLNPAVSVIHDAQRTSHRKIKYLGWHLTSMLRFFLSRPFRMISWRRLTGRPESHDVAS